ncbi:hypothetical protein E4T49_00930 [Aureobasidium sp. EXF-10728]|nr:hypothetical protein E4T49_00930 [Aureobasidium sp. EXF-10728]
MEVSVQLPSLKSDLNDVTPRPPSKSARRPLRQSGPGSDVGTVETQSRTSGARTGYSDRSPLKPPSTLQIDGRTAFLHERSLTQSGSSHLNTSPSTKYKTFSKLPRSSSIHNSPAFVSPILDSLPTSLSSQRFVSPVSSPEVPSEIGKATGFDESNVQRLPRSSSLYTPEPWNGEKGLGIGVTLTGSSVTADQDRKYLPAVHSFSRPRTQFMDRSPVSAKSPAVPLSDSQQLLMPKTPSKDTPTIVRSSPSMTSRSPVTADILTFAGRKLGTPTDLAALDHGSVRSSNRKDRSVSDDVFEYTRVKQLSGSLLSSGGSFVGSTLSISDEADQLILGKEGCRTPSFISQTNLTAPTNAESKQDTDFELPSPSENGFHVSWPADFGFKPASSAPDSPTVQSSPSVRPKAFSSISEESVQSAVETEQRHDDLGTNSENRGKDITTTLSILEGIPSLADTASSTGPQSLKARFGTAMMPQTASTNSPQDLVDNVRNARVPSYMMPTPASEARKNTTVSPPGNVRNNASTPSLSTRRASQNIKLPPRPDLDKGRIAAPNKQSSVSELCGSGRSGRTTPNPVVSRSATPIARPSVGSQLPGSTTTTTPKPNPKTEPNHRMSIGHIRISRQSPHPIETSRDGTFPPTRPRSGSKGKAVLNNLKGLFSGKRDGPPTPSHRGRRFSIGSRKSVTTEVDVPDVPPLPKVPPVPAVPTGSALLESRAKSAPKSILVKKTAAEEVQSSNSEASKESCIPPRLRRKSSAKGNLMKKEVPEEDRPSLRRKTSKHEVAAKESTEGGPEKATSDSVALMEMVLTLREQAFKEDDLVRKERMTSFAQVMLDTVTNAVEAERNMYAAMQAAEQAKMSYMMTQQSVQEMSKIVSTSQRQPPSKKKKRADNI